MPSLNALVFLLFSFGIASYSISDQKTDFDGKVIIIGAGAAGMTAGYLLAQQGVDFQILEAAPTYGGRIKQNTTFTDFPLPLGGEWLHVKHSVLQKIVNNPAIKVMTQTQPYTDKDRWTYFEDGELETGPLDDFGDRKFVNTSWLSFFNQYIVPSIRSKMTFNTKIVSIDYQGNKIRLLDQQQNPYEADKVIVTVPLKILQRGDIQFLPPLPSEKIASINSAKVWGGLKVFIEFSEKFYLAYLEFPDSVTKEGERFYYDAAHAQDTTSNIFAFFSLGKQAEQYLTLSDVVLKETLLKELDTIYNGKASQSYVKHLVQNWNNEPFIGATYLEDHADSAISRVLAKPIGNKLFFAGEAYTEEDDWGAVHNATRSAKAAVGKILGH